MRTTEADVAVVNWGGGSWWEKRRGHICLTQSMMMMMIGAKQAVGSGEENQSADHLLVR